MDQLIKEIKANNQALIRHQAKKIKVKVVNCDHKPLKYFYEDDYAFCDYCGKKLWQEDPSGDFSGAGGYDDEVNGR